MKPLTWIRNKIRIFLGIEKLDNDVINLLHKINDLDERTSDLFNMGVDVHFKSPHMILIYSKLKGGQIRHIDIDIKDLRELINITQELKQRYGIKQEFWDEPPHMKQFKNRYHV